MPRTVPTETGAGRLLFPQSAGLQDGQQAALRLSFGTNQDGRYQHKEAGGQPGRSGTHQADFRDVR